MKDYVVFDLGKELKRFCKRKKLKLIKSDIYDNTYYIKDEEKGKSASQIYVMAREIISDCDAQYKYQGSYLIVSDGDVIAS